MNCDVIKKTIQLWTNEPEKAQVSPVVKAQTDGAQALVEARVFSPGKPTCLRLSAARTRLRVRQPCCWALWQGARRSLFATPLPRNSESGSSQFMRKLSAKPTFEGCSEYLGSRQISRILR